MKRNWISVCLSFVAAVMLLAGNGCSPTVKNDATQVSAADPPLKAAPPPAGVTAVALEPLPLTPSSSGTATSLGGAEDANATAAGAAATGTQPGTTGQPKAAGQPAGGGTPNLFSGFLGKVTGGGATTSSPAIPPGNPNHIVPAGGTPVQLPPGNTPPGNLPRGNLPPGAGPPGAGPPGFVPGPGVPPGGRMAAINGRRVTVDANGRPLPGSPDIPGNPTIPGAAGGNNGKAKIVTGSGKELEKATTGVGAQGRGYGLGIVTTPVASYFAAQQSIVFKIQIPSGMNTFKAYNNRFPKSAEEFQKEILDPANITLPELPVGECYNYDPATGELGVVHPSKDGASSSTNSGSNDQTDDAITLQGTWVEISSVLGGKDATEKEVMTIKAGKVLIGPPGAKDPIDFGLKVVTNTNPKQLDFLHPTDSDPRPVEGIYELTADKLTLCQQFDQSKGRPNAFVSPPGSRINLKVFQRHN